MILKRIFNTLVFVLSVFSSLAQNHHTRFETIDVQHYSFEIHLNDSTNRIEGKTNVSVKFLKAAENIVFDLVGTGEDNYGMSLVSIKMKNSVLEFVHKDNELKITLPKTAQTGDVLNFEIQYSGIPADGLVISENKYGERTFFGDNWPDRAKHWLPTVDHPSDKATLEFKIYAPRNYVVVSNGFLVEKKQIANNLEFTHWHEDVPISTKLMVIGAANFSVGNDTTYNDIPVSSWVFQQNKKKGFENYKYGTEALEYFSELIGPYSYEKLAHVQSKTRYGGMENASCIFYHENTAISDRSQEGLFAHEVAHQWFGNSVTEQNWHHVWLSEGFATYLTHVYKQHFHGEEVFREGLKNDRERVIKYAKRNLAPVIDTTITEYIRLLNANSYQKASWFLHMLRADLGNEVFFKGLQKYYADFQNSTALTKDFQKVMETVSGKELDLFFNQWLRQPGHPVLSYSWGTTTEDDKIKEQYFSLVQKNKKIFSFPIEVKVSYKDGSSEIKCLYFSKEQNEIRSPVKTSSIIHKVTLDPKVKLLFELQLKKL